MAKLQSSLKNMVLSLTLISLGMATALGYVYNLTKGPIEESAKKAEVAAITAVLPPFDNDPTKEVSEFEGLTFYKATKGGQLVGYAIKTFSSKAFSGRFDIMVGLLPDGTINNTQVIEQKETPGLGAKMTEPKFKDQFNNKNPENFKLLVKKDGGDVDAITASTITSRAYCDAIQKAIDQMKKNFSKPEGIDSLPSDSLSTQGGQNE